MKKNTLELITCFATIIIIHAVVLAVACYWSYSKQKRANEEFYKAMEEDRKYLNEQQQKEAEERLKMLHDILTIDAQRGENEED